MSDTNQSTAPALCRCYVCGGNLSTQATTCPHCGEPYKQPPRQWLVIDVTLGVVLGGVGLSFIAAILCGLRALLTP